MYVFTTRKEGSRSQVKHERYLVLKNPWNGIAGRASSM